MNTRKLMPLAVILLFTSCKQEKMSTFDRFFTNATMRIDYFHTGDAKSEKVEIDGVFKYEKWAGSLVNLVDQLNYGAYYHKVYDKASGDLIYSKGFDSYFKEYQVSTPAIEGQVKQFHESAILPFPKADIIYKLEKREKSGQYAEVFSATVNPEDANESTVDPDIKVYTGLESGASHIKADILIVGEGYTAEEDEKFQDDLKRFTEIFFRAEPCISNKDKFNIRGVLKPSVDSGIDEPRAGIDKSTSVNATFNSMGSERYVLTEDNKSLRDIAGHAPYDALYIMVNSSRYGGGGIYNFYCVYTSDNINSDYLMVHEFGHSFFGLADEYYTSSTAYNDFYPQDYEPAEANITALKDPENVKWKHLLSEGIEMPTPWLKASYDSIDLVWQAQRAKMNDHIAELQKGGAKDEDVARAKAEYDQRSTQRDEEAQAYLEGSRFAGMVGAFEGAGYASKGLYRSSINCIMFTRTNYFCTVCREAMVEVIESYSR